MLVQHSTQPHQLLVCCVYWVLLAWGLDWPGLLAELQATAVEQSGVDGWQEHVAIEMGTLGARWVSAEGQ